MTELCKGTVWWIVAVFVASLIVPRPWNELVLILGMWAAPQIERTLICARLDEGLSP